jgi:hypothetical protein
MQIKAGILFSNDSEGAIDVWNILFLIFHLFGARFCKTHPTKPRPIVPWRKICLHTRVPNATPASVRLPPLRTRAHKGLLHPSKGGANEGPNRRLVNCSRGDEIRDRLAILSVLN